MKWSLRRRIAAAAFGLALVAAAAVLVLVRTERQPGAMGWHHNQAEIDAVKATLAVPHFGDTPAGRAALGADADVYLWEAAIKATGAVLPARNQGQVGSCVGFGTSSVIEYLICVQIAHGQRQEFKALAQEVTYGGSRVQIGGGQIRGDGSVGAWAAKWAQQYGVVARGVYGSIDLTAYSEQRCRQYGTSGCPDALVPIAKQSPVKGIAQVRSADECVQALRQGYPVSVCSVQGFAMKRDADGFLKKSGRWGHCQAIIGYSAGPRKGFYILNSWGTDPYGGPTGKGNPPAAGAWVDYITVDAMLAEGDSWAFSDAAGFPSRKPLEWSAAPTRPRETAATLPRSLHTAAASKTRDLPAGVAW